MAPPHPPRTIVQLVLAELLTRRSSIQQHRGQTKFATFKKKKNSAERYGVNDCFLDFLGNLMCFFASQIPR